MSDNTGTPEPQVETTSVFRADLLKEMSGATSAPAATGADNLPAGSALLVVKRGPNAGARFLLDQPTTTAGRHPESDIFLDDVTVSRRHAEFRINEGEFEDIVHECQMLGPVEIQVVEHDLAGGLLDTDLAWQELSERAPERAGELTAVDREVLEQAAREIMLYHLDLNWSEHLALMDDVRESIHLRAIARETPLDEYHRIAVREFKTLAQQAVDDAVETFRSVVIDDRGAHLDDAGLARPSATWTYMVSDNPLAGSGNSVISGIGNIFR